MLVLGPMPAVVGDLPDDLRILADERRVNQATLWELFTFYWPSYRVPRTSSHLDGYGFGVMRGIWIPGK